MTSTAAHLGHAYQGIRVIDLSQGIAGPECGALLAQHGAKVIKVEPPAGDWSRALGEMRGDQSVLHATYNRGKHGIVLDLKSAAGGRVARRLIGDADVVIESARPGAMARLGLDYASVAKDRSGLIYVSISGFGQRGPKAAERCTDTVAQAFSGLMSVNKGADGTPHRVGTTIVDHVTGLYAFQAVAAALYARRDGAPGCHLDISLMQAAAAAQAPKIAEAALRGASPANLNAPAGSYRAADGWLAVTLVREDDFRRLAQVLGLDGLADDPRFADFARRDRNLAPLVAVLKPRFAERTVADWCDLLGARQVLAEPVHDYLDWLGDDHVAAIGAAPETGQPEFGLLRLAAVPGAPDGRGLAPAPGLGADAATVLRELNYSPDEIAALLDETRP